MLFNFFTIVSLQLHANDISKETVNNGLNVIIDTQNCSLRCARQAIQYVNDSFDGKDVKMYALRPEVFWDKQRVDNCTKTQKYLDVNI